MSELYDKRVANHFLADRHAALSIGIQQHSFILPCK